MSTLHPQLPSLPCSDVTDRVSTDGISPDLSEFGWPGSQNLHDGDNGGADGWSPLQLWDPIGR